ncbi:hypothetical protein N9682_03635 [Candidatus Pelagibacter sp.]|nr:hypothetical protein [Candidatus Pelagibacter sp.]
MKNSDRDTKLSITDSSFIKDVFLDEIKTTNVNILLNRVRIEKKNDFKKKIIISFLMIIVITIFTIFTIFTISK